MKFFKSVTKTISLLVAVGIISFATSSNLFGTNFSGNKGNKSNIKILSYNIRIAHPPSKGWDEVDLQATARVIKQANPDLVALQEVDVFTERSGKSVHQAKELAKMTGMNYFFAKAIDRSEGDYGVAVLSRFPIIEAKGYRLPVHDSLKHEIRTLAVIKVQLPCGDSIIFSSAHLDHISDEDRLLQVQKMTEILNQYKKLPVILGADLNMTSENEVMDILHNTLTIDFENFPLTFPSVNPQRTIDYILMNNVAHKKFNLLDYTTIKEEYASDHLPLKVVLRNKH